MSHEGDNRQSRSGQDRRVSDDNGKANWDLILKVAQVAIYPLFAAMIYMLMQMHVLDRRLAVIEVTTARPATDVDLARKIAVFEYQQSEVSKKLSENASEIRKIADAISDHDAREGYKKDKLR